MDLRLFHPEHSPNGNFKVMDYLNSQTYLLPCEFLEWSGWYYRTVPLRLLGHYRLFHHYKKYHPGESGNALPINRYILHHRAAFDRKYQHGRPITEIHNVNRVLLNERSYILYDFLAHAEPDFETAYRLALQQINDPSFLSTPETANILVQVQHDHNTNNYNHTSYSHNELIINPVIKEEVPAKGSSAQPSPVNTAMQGKVKDVFSKRQVLILFDLLSQSAKTEPFDLRNANKHASFAKFLFALTGKSKETWLEELKNYRNKDLYAFRDAGELSQLLNTLTNLSDILRGAGLRTLSSQADKKIRELELKR